MDEACDRRRCTIKVSWVPYGTEDDDNLYDWDTSKNTGVYQISFREADYKTQQWPGPGIKLRREKLNKALKKYKGKGKGKGWNEISQFGHHIWRWKDTAKVSKLEGKINDLLSNNKDLTGQDFMDILLKAARPNLWAFVEWGKIDPSVLKSKYSSAESLWMHRYEDSVKDQLEDAWKKSNTMNVNELEQVLKDSENLANLKYRLDNDDDLYKEKLLKLYKEKLFVDTLKGMINHEKVTLNKLSNSYQFATSTGHLRGGKRIKRKTRKVSKRKTRKVSKRKTRKVSKRKNNKKNKSFRRKLNKQKRR